MTQFLSRRQIAGVVVFFAVSAALTLGMLAELGTVPLPGRHVRTVTAVLSDAEGLPSQADVLVHGVKVGAVSSISVRASGTTLVTLALGPGTPPLHRDASVRVGFKTAFGEPFVDLDPGTSAAPLQARGARLRVVPSVEIDDALAFLDAGGRANLDALLHELGAGAASPQTAAEVSGTLAGLDTATASIGRLTGELSAQGADLRGLVQDGRATLDVLAGRSSALRSLTLAARETLTPLDGQRTALTAVLSRLPGLLTGAQATLTELAPVIARATPLAVQARAAAPALTAALRALPASATALDQILDRATSLRATVVPLLRAIDGVTGPGATALAELGPALADIIPIAQYLGPRGNTIAAWFANTAALGDHGDAKGDWARFFVGIDPSTVLGAASGAPPVNAYTAPDDAADNQPYRAGHYPRLLPYMPALARAGTRR
jgi:phospholipid/cholesterol/gamma-HCH transport system substrate-binding protein